MVSEANAVMRRGSVPSTAPSQMDVPDELKRNNLPPGRKRAERWKVSPSRSFVQATACPPIAGTRNNGPNVAGLKRIAPSAAHEPCAELVDTSVRVCGSPP